MFATDKRARAVGRQLDADGEPDSVDAALWGIESEGDEYHEEVIGELITKCVHQITATIGE